MSAPTPAPSRLRRTIEWLSDLQIRRPAIPFLIVGVVTAFFGWHAAHLELRTRFDALLPDSQPSVIELHRLEQRTAASQSVLVFVEGPDTQVVRGVGDALVSAFQGLGRDIVSSAEDGVQVARDFLTPRAGLFLELEDLRQVRDDINRRWDYETAKETGLLLEDDGPPVTIEAIEKRFRKRLDKEGEGLPRPDGYYQTVDGKQLMVVVRSPIPGGDLDRIAPALARMHQVVDQVLASRPEYRGVEVSFAGDMPTGFLEYGSVRNDLASVGASGVALVLLVVLLYFMRLRAVLVMAITIVVGLVWTFGLTRLVIGHLNVATGFLVSIVAGNGINVGILYQSRYYEERRRGVPTAEALRRAVIETWQPTVIAAVAAAASYGSLFVTDFRAFRQFGFIAASGMLLCWIVKTMMVPPLLLVLDRMRPMVEAVEAPGGSGLIARVRRSGVEYGRVFAWLVPRAPWLFVGLGFGLIGWGVWAGIDYVRRDPMEYDLGATENDPQDHPELHRAWRGADRILGPGHSGMVVATDSAEEARQLQQKLKADWDAAPADRKPFSAVHSLWDLVPDDQPEKIAILSEIRARLVKAHDRGFIEGADWERVKEQLPPADLAPYTLDQLPEPIARGYSERDGTRGRLVVIEPEGKDSTDLRYLLRYSDSFRETRLPSGKIVRGSGRAVIFADMLQAVVRDIPRAVSLSLAFTLLSVMITFRRGGLHAITVLLSLLTGAAGLLTFLHHFHVKLNFLNFAAIPITFGIGVDYAINIAQRHRADGSRDILAALRTTGGAVVLCSLTTIVGYLALLGSVNRAIRSLGTIAVVGEVSCLLAAVTVLPAMWLLIERRQKRKAAVEPGSGPA